MRGAPLAVIALCWASLADATEVLICEASVEMEYAGDTFINQYELDLAIDDTTSRLLTATAEDDTSDVVITALLIPPPVAPPCHLCADLAGRRC